MSDRATLEQPLSGDLEANRFYVWMVASVAAISGFLFGFDTAVINGALVFLRRQFALTSLLTEIAASSLLLGCLIGAASAGKFSDRLGRRKSLILNPGSAYSVGALHGALVSLHKDRADAQLVRG